MMTTCAVCGKRIAVMWPEFYVYKKKDVFFCGQDCMIVHDTKTQRELNGFQVFDMKKKKKGTKKTMKRKLTAENKKKAVEIAIQGGDFLTYLKEAGAKNPSAAWWYIRETLAKADPEKYQELTGALASKKPVVEIAEKLPPEAQAVMPEYEGHPSEGPAMIKMEPLGKDMPEEEDPADYELMAGGEIVHREYFEPKKELTYKITEIMTDLGAFKKDSRDGLIYWTTEEGEKVILTHREWNRLAESIPQILDILEG